MAVTAVDHSATESLVRARVEAELAAELARRDRTRLRIDDQPWVHELVGRVVGEELRRAATSVAREELEEMWKRVFAAVTPLGPLAEHLADPDVVKSASTAPQPVSYSKRGGATRSRLPSPMKQR